ncbi:MULTISPECIES: PolC-type DNA polymerase III [Coprobacillaceae]|uniref:PolC-type DNA polymerase III n=1 Tax=Coprobacillaceae TaxID=2810280 RepID=UPI000E539207|nr:MULTISPECIES: PolC-type DNA polymerase III [Coprobacillaceae]RHM63725.1 PolC-type DNA polymerase III [Coprobacillus sp. AF33-1AC]RHS96454.1 PolC-type DNA polymerase III [Erysipelatoclostridium sp. AM42-17]
MNKLIILLENLNITEQVTELLHASLDKVIVHKNSHYSFYIESKSFIPFDEFQLLYQGLKHFPYPAEFYLHYQDVDVTQCDWSLYLGYMIENLKLNYPICSTLSIENFKIDDIVTVAVLNEIQLEQYQKMYAVFSNELAKIGIDKKIKFYINQDNTEFNDLKEEMEVYEPVKVDLQTLKKEEPKPTPQFDYKRRYKRGEAREMKIEEIDNNTMEKNCVIRGYVFKVDMIKTRAGKHIQTLWVTDYTNSIMVKRFENNSSNTIEDLKSIGKGKVWVKVRGETRLDSFAREMVIMANEVEIIKSPQHRKDSAEKKRVELHTHSKMSAMDGIGTITDYINAVASWGHKAIAVTDHGNVQSFPEAQIASSKAGIKMIYGVELNMIEPYFDIVFNERDMSIEDATYVSFDLETTGFSVVHDGITEFGAVKIKNGEVIDRLQSFINPGKEISTRISNLTNITNEMVSNAPTIKEFLPQILDFFSDCILVAHNAKFDIGFLNENLKRNQMPTINNPIIDSLALARAIMKPMKSYRLGAVCRVYRVAYDDEVAHRADYDAEVLGSVLTMMLHQIMQDNKYNLLDLNKLQKDDAYKIVFPYHMTAIALNKVGLKNMFKIVSEANTTYFHDGSRIPKERLEFYREGLLYGTSCYRSDVFEAAMNQSQERLESLLQFYDYVEIQPLDDYYHLIDRGQIENQDDLIDSILRLIETAKKLNKIVVATGDVHFLEKKDKIYRDVFISQPKIGIGHRAHPLCNRRNPRAFTPYQYLRTTDEMLTCYPYLSPQDAYQYVVENTNKIADMVEEIRPVHDHLFTPKIDNADENLTKICYETAHKLYGEKLPTIVEKRLEKELSNIIKHGFGVIYYISHLLVKKSNDDGYLVGSRGSVGSSFVATMAGITEVNPLPPHYVCLHCGYSEFLDEGVIADGYDLEDKECPHCHQMMKGEGHNIPFETFLGFNADKVPDIDLNFSGAYQAKAHAFTKTIFGEDHVFRAGTISTVAEKTAYGYAKGYAETLGIDNQIRSAELERIAEGCGGVKRTTGQHPGGIIVIPRDYDVFDFTPYQYPADDLSAEWRTTHFDFHAIHDNVLKFDILGHVDPTVIRMLQDLTGVDPKTIPTNDKKVMSLFTSSEALGCDLSFINCKNGALGLPEFGTTFVRGMLDQTKPQTFNDLVIISGLSHGTDVYLGNAETLIKNGTCTLKEVIGCRDDIMVYLIEKGLPNKDAFDIMECVRKGKSPAVFPEKKYEELMKQYNVPQWYIDSCKKIKYMFPKAHAVAYVLSAIRVAWWKLYYPLEYYAVYFTTRCDFYEIETLVAGKEAIMARRKEIEELKANHQASNKEEGLWDVFEIALEMIERGYHFNPINLELSDATNFILDPYDDKGLIPPFSSVDSLGESVAKTVIEARKVNHFISKEDVIKRTKLNNSHIKLLTKMGVFEGMQEENQLSLF